MPEPLSCLVTGATGYIGGRLVPELLAAGHHVRVMVRDPRRVSGQSWASSVEVAVADAQNAAAVTRALDGVTVAYYLLHSIGTGPDFAEAELRMAETFARAAADRGVRRIIYLGGLNPRDEELSEHLASRAQVGGVLLTSDVPTAVLSAAAVIGSGSASFEMLRHLTERLPVMVTPRWVHTRIQPIAVGDVLRYLVGCVGLPPATNRRFDIGGPDVLTYRDMMRRYARIAGLPKRRILPVPVLSPKLSSLWVGLVTPVPSSLARPLVESLRNTVVCSENDISAYVPAPPGGLTGFDRAVELALTKIQQLEVPTRWSSASTPGAPSEPLPSDPQWAGGDLYVDERVRDVAAAPSALWRVVEGIGGHRGWYSWPLAWTVRGVLDRLTGGPGLRRGRRHPDELVVGDAVDWWRVEEVEDGRLLRLRAELRLPGLAWLEFEVLPGAGGGSVLRQRALFHPRGATGHAYWRAISPFHGVVFGGMHRELAKVAERLVTDPAVNVKLSRAQPPA